MENRFGVKDFFLFLFLGALIVIILLAMKQNDRQFQVLQAIEQQGEDQMHELTGLHRDMNRLQITATVEGAVSPATQPGRDPFIYQKQAEAMPGYSQGDWFVNVGPNSDKMTPFLAGDTYAQAVQNHVLDTLCGLDEVTLEQVANIASIWQVHDNTRAYFDYQKSKGLSDDQMLKDPNAPSPEQVTFQLRHDVMFSDGVALTSEDVVWTYRWIMNPNVDAPRDRAYDAKIKSVVANGPYEVTFTLGTPYFDPVLLCGGIYILPKHFYEKYSPDDFNKSTGLLLGSGPYRMEDPTRWSPGQTVMMLRNDRYWGEPPPFDRVVYRVIDNDLARLTAFRNGELDIYGDQLVYPAQPEPYQRLLADPNIVARTQHFEYDTPLGGYRFIGWNERQRNGKPGIFADKRVRQAMTMMIDRDRICSQIMRGYVTPISGPFYIKGKQNNPDVKPWPFDVARAKALLKEAGFVDDGSGVLKEPDGSPFQFSLTYPSGVANYDEMALFIKDSLAKAGVTLIPDPLDWSVFSDRLKNHNFEAIAMGWSATIEDDLYQIFDSSQIAGGGDNFISYSDPELDRLIEQARSTVDPAIRMPLWRKCHAVLNEDQPYTFIFARKGLTFLDGRIKNVKTVPLGLNSETEWFVPRLAQRWEK
ncbi:MAG: ABC transporter substrate-binding protein [Tepidisphaeraceae bacterium]